MAHSLSNLVLKRIQGSPCSVRQMVSVIRQNRGFSNLPPSDPDTHEDFQPTSKTEGASISYKDIIEQDVKESPVMIYMKGHPQAPRCGFSAMAVRVLVEYGVPINSRNILEDHDFKKSVKDFSHWPTFPQIFIRGEFIGGSDILLDMHRTGELKEKLKGISNQATD